MVVLAVTEAGVDLGDGLTLAGAADGVLALAAGVVLVTRYGVAGVDPGGDALVLCVAAGPVTRYGVACPGVDGVVFVLCTDAVPAGA